DAPSQADARSEVALIADVVLNFVAQAEAESEAWLQAPVVLHEKSRVNLAFAQQRISRRDGELAGSAARGDDLRKRNVLRDALLHDRVRSQVEERELAGEIILGVAFVQ